jgi:hypothetical protein
MATEKQRPNRPMGFEMRFRLIVLDGCSPSAAWSPLGGGREILD